MCIRDSPSQPLQLDTERYDMVVLGHEHIAPYAKPAADGHSAFAFPGTPERPVPYLGYAPGAYLGAVTDEILKKSSMPIHLSRVHETDMAEGLKVMAVEGHGVAFLPRSAVRKELQSHALVPVAFPGGTSLELTMEVRAYRARHVSTAAGPSHAQDLWHFLTTSALAKETS